MSSIRKMHTAEYDLWKVPDEVKELKIVKVGDFDVIPCTGQHVDNTREIGRVHIFSYGRRDNGLLRIRFKLSPLHKIS